VTNFFASPQIPMQPNPEPPGMAQLRDMLMQRIFQQNSNPYGFNPSFQGNFQFNPSGGRGLMNPVTGQYGQAPGGAGAMSYGGPPQSGGMGGPGGGGGGGGMQLPPQLMQMLQAMMGGGGGMPPGGAPAGPPGAGGRAPMNVPMRGGPPPAAGANPAGASYDAEPDKASAAPSAPMDLIAAFRDLLSGVTPGGTNDEAQREIDRLRAVRAHGGMPGNWKDAHDPANLSDQIEGYGATPFAVRPPTSFQRFAAPRAYVPHRLQLGMTSGKPF